MSVLSPVERPIVRWHGGKWLLAPWIIDHFPAHKVYVEPFGGGGSVLLRKPRSYAEIYNDLDRRIVTLFRVLRDETKAARLVGELEMTPFARDEFEAAYRTDSDDDVDQSRALLIKCLMGFGTNAHGRKSGFRANSNRSGTTPAHDWRNFPDGLVHVVERLRGVVIENRPAIDVMRAHDCAAALHYVDPPYVAATRDKGRDYEFEMTDFDHVELLAFLRGLSGAVVLSGYRSALYDDALPGWRRVERRALADGARERIECLWLNDRAQSATRQEALI